MSTGSKSSDRNVVYTLCKNCMVSQKCLGHDANADDSCLYNSDHGQRLLLHRGDYLYRAGEPFQALYMIRSGVIKTYFISEDGEEQILGFHLPGEIIGFDGIAESQFPSTATALDTTSICRLPLGDPERHRQHSAQLQNALLKGMSQEILRHENMLMLLGKKKADERLASFLLNRSEYQSTNGYSATTFTLAMTRTDMGKYLGLTVETVSRVLSRMQAQKVIAVHTNQIQILDLKALRRLAGDHMGKKAQPTEATGTATHFGHAPRHARTANRASVGNGTPGYLH